MNICLFEKDEIGKPLSLRDERAKHILKILHKNVGDSFRAGIIDGEEGEAKITKIEKFSQKSADGKKSFDDGTLYFTFEAKNLGKRLYPLKMIIGFPRPIQLKRLLRDMAGLGVCEIHLCGTDLVEKSYLDSDLADENELHKLLLEGTIQAGGTFVPKVFLYENLDKCLRTLLTEEGKNASLSKENCKTKYFALDNVNPKSSLVQELNLFADEKTSLNAEDSFTNGEFFERLTLGEENSGFALNSENFQARKEATLCKENCESTVGATLGERSGEPCLKNAFAAIGSERGWSDRERNLLESFGFVRCSLGSRILRTETAATVAATLILAKMNFL